MALTQALSNAAVNAEIDALAALCNSGYLRLYTTPQPADADTGVSTQTLLAELRFGSTAFGSAVAGVATANAITSDSSNNDTGTAVWFRAFKSDGTTVLFDGSVGTSGCNCNLNSTSIVSGGTTAVSSLTLTGAKT